MRPSTGKRTARQPAHDSGRSQVTRRNHMLFAAMVGSLALLLFAAGATLLILIGVGSEDDISAVPLLGEGIGAAALAVRHFFAA